MRNETRDKRTALPADGTMQAPLPSDLRENGDSAPPA